MKVARILFPLILLFPISAFAGNVFGNLKEGGRSVGQGVEVRVQCGDSAPSTTKTDEYGAYTINVAQGRCQLSVGYKGQWTPPFTIVSTDEPARYDFDLVYENGRYVLKRR